MEKFKIGPLMYSFVSGCRFMVMASMKLTANNTTQHSVLSTHTHTLNEKLERNRHIHRSLQMCTTMPHVDTAHTEHNKSRTKQNWERFQKKVLRRHKMRLQMGIMVKWTFNLNAASLEWCAKTVNARRQRERENICSEKFCFSFSIVIERETVVFFRELQSFFAALRSVYNVRCA